MSERDENDLWNDPHYVQGQIVALRPMVLTVAELLPRRRQEFVRKSLERLEQVTARNLARPRTDTYLLAIEHAEELLRAIE